MTIGVVHTRFDRSGGAEGYALRLVSGLAARGHEVHAFGRRATGLPRGVAFHRVRALPFGRALKTWSFARLAARAVSADRFDVIQGFCRTTCQTVHRASGGIHRSYLERLGSPRLSWYDRVSCTLEDRLFASPGLRAIVCPSTWVARDVARFYPAAARLVRVIPNGVDTVEFCPDGRTDEANWIRHDLEIHADAQMCLFVAMDFRRKGLDVAVRALASLPSAHLVVVGAGRSRPFRALAGTLGVEQRLHFAGPQADMAPWYRAADVLVHPTRYDPCANVCLEAIACGTPVVTTVNDGAGEIIRSEPAGVVLPSPTAPEDVARSVGALIAGGRDTRAAARRLAERHDMQASLDALEHLYTELCGQA